MQTCLGCFGPHSFTPHNRSPTDDCLIDVNCPDLFLRGGTQVPSLAVDVAPTHFLMRGAKVAPWLVAMKNLGSSMPNKQVFWDEDLHVPLVFWLPTAWRSSDKSGSLKKNIRCQRIHGRPWTSCSFPVHVDAFLPCLTFDFP